MCEVCNINETVEHVIINCQKYNEERMSLRNWLRKEKIRFDMKELLQ